MFKNMFFNKWFLIPGGVFAGLVLLLYAADLFLKSRPPNFYKAPEFFCESRYAGITLPPAGIFICEESFNSERLRAHELVHWGQYQRTSSFGFYARYAWGWASSGFSYENNPMEVEAREVNN